MTPPDKCRDRSLLGLIPKAPALTSAAAIFAPHVRATELNMCCTRSQCILAAFSRLPKILHNHHVAFIVA